MRRSAPVVRAVAVGFFLSLTSSAIPTALAGVATTPAWSVDSDQDFSNLGTAVAVAGDVNGDGFSDVLVGTPFFSSAFSIAGKAEFFAGGPAGPSLSAMWTRQGPSDGALLGLHVAPAGDVNGDGFDDILVAAPNHFPGPDTLGLVALYHGGPSGPGASPAFRFHGTTAGDNEQTVAAMTAGDVNADGYDDVLVIWEGEQGSSPRAGSGTVPVPGGGNPISWVELFLGSAAGVQATAAWTSQTFAGGGIALAASSAGDVNADGFGDVIIGDADYIDIPLGGGAVGIALVFPGSPGGLGTELWSELGLQNQGGYGTSVSLAGDVNGDGFGEVLVGEPGLNSNTGRATMYFGSAGGPSLSADWVAHGAHPNAQHGASVATAGDVNGDGLADVVVGAPGFTNGQSNEGALHVYFGRYGTTPGSSPDVSIESDRIFSNLGTASTAGDVNGDGFSDVLGGAPLYDDPEEDEGGAFIYYGSGDIPPAQASAVEGLEVPQSSCEFGTAIAFAGDFNQHFLAAPNLSFTDFVAGAPRYDGGAGADAGLVKIFHGGRSYSQPGSPAVEIQGSQAGARFGYAVAGGGDVNGDGWSEILVGAPQHDDPTPDEGKAFLYRHDGSNPVVGWSAGGDQASAHFGYAVAVAGDVNGDGYADVIVGAPDFDNGQPDEGRAFLYQGSSLGLAATPAWTAEADQSLASFASAVAGAGDVNGDGYSDVIVGSQRFSNGQSLEGRAFVYHGSPLGLASAPAWTAESDQANALMGYSVAGAGDVNGDGYSDVLVGAPTFDNGETDEGRTFLYLGSASGLAASPAWTFESDEAFSYFGFSVATAWDVNGDGYSDVLVGAPLASNKFANEGRVSLFTGSTAGLGSVPARTTFGGEAGAFLGYAVAGIGNPNADAGADIAAGAIYLDAGASDAGGLLVFLGLGASPDYIAGRQPRQMHVGSTLPVGLLGSTNHETDWEYGLRAQGLPSGRVRARPEWSIAQLGTSLSSVPVETLSTWENVPSLGEHLQFTDTGLSPDRHYHWRLRIAMHSPYFPRTPWVTASGSTPSLEQFKSKITAGTDVAALPGAAGDRALLTVRAIRPNPFQAGRGREVTLWLSLARTAPVTLAIFDVAGRRVALLHDGPLAAGEHAVQWNGRDAEGREVPAGVYFARAQGGGASGSAKLVLSR